MASKPIIYLAYLLRLWRSGPDSAWRASLEDPQTGQRIGFSTLDAVFQFLQQKAAGDSVAAVAAPSPDFLSGANDGPRSETS